MKQCTSCHKTKPFSSFRKNKRAKDGYQYFCTRCASRKIRAMYDKKYADKVRMRTLTRSQLHREVISKIKIKGCELCPETDIACMDFHHRDPFQKDFTISARYNKSIESLLQEVSKCAVVCRNCHAKIHEGTLKLEDSMHGA
jgi:protein-arginine kinase activator protein McsA